MNKNPTTKNVVHEQDGQVTGKPQDSELRMGEVDRKKQREKVKDRFVVIPVRLCGASNHPAVSGK